MKETTTTCDNCKEEQINNKFIEIGSTSGHDLKIEIDFAGDESTDFVKRNNLNFCSVKCLTRFINNIFYE